MPKKFYRLDDFEEKHDISQYTLLGIAGFIQYYRFCHNLNHLLQVDFEMKEPIQIKLSRTKNYVHFLRLQAKRYPGEKTYEVITNKWNGEILLPELAHFDLLLKIETELSSAEGQKLCASIKKIPEVVMATLVNTSLIKNIERIFIKE